MSSVGNKSSQIGGFSQFRIRMGGQIRFSFPVNDSTSDFFEGNVLELNADGTVQLDTDETNGKLKGIAIEKRESGDPFDDLTIGSGQASLLLDEAILEDAQLSSGVVFSVNDLVFTDGVGNLTTVASGPTLGVAISDAVANAGDVLTFFHTNQLV